jgi:hypothetical protein
MNKVTIQHSSAWRIRFPKHSNGSLLFLEWLGNYRAIHKHQLDFSVSTKPNADDVLSDDFQIGFKAISKESAMECFEYIKSNI